MSIAENARYGLHDGSGTRNSIRLAFGWLPVIGIRMQAERLRWRVDQVDRRLEARAPAGGTSSATGS